MFQAGGSIREHHVHAPRDVTYGIETGADAYIVEMMAKKWIDDKGETWRNLSSIQSAIIDRANLCARSAWPDFVADDRVLFWMSTRVVRT